MGKKTRSASSPSEIKQSSAVLTFVEKTGGFTLIQLFTTQDGMAEAFTITGAKHVKLSPDITYKTVSGGKIAYSAEDCLISWADTEEAKPTHLRLFTLKPVPKSFDREKAEKWKESFSVLTKA